jgi:hypothetical protein
MPATPFAVLLRALALVSGGGALVLVALARASFRGSPFGSLLALLGVLLALVTGLSALTLVAPDRTLVIELVEAVTYTWLVVFVAMLVRLHGRLATRPGRGRRG